MNASDEEEFQRFKAWREIQGVVAYNPPWATRVKNSKLGFKFKKSDEGEQTKSTKRPKLKSARNFCI